MMMFSKLAQNKQNQRVCRPQSTGGVTILERCVKSQPYVVYVVPCVLAALCYLNGLTGQFLHDDKFAIQNNRDVTGESSIFDVFRNDFWGMRMSDSNSHKSYRPLCVLSFRLDHYLSGGSPSWFHSVNTLLHIIVTHLLSLVCLRVLHTSGLCALLTASLFAVHPVHTEAVTGLVGRADVMAALFFLSSFYLYSRCVVLSPSTSTDINHNKIIIAATPIKLSSQAIYLATSLLCASLAMLCKETGLSVLAVCLAYDLLLNFPQILRCLKRRKLSAILSQCLGRCSIIFVVVIILLFLRLWIMNFQPPTVFNQESNPASFSASHLTRILTFNFLPTFNLWLLFCPIQLSYDWTGGSIPLISSLADPRNLCTLTLYMVTFWLALKSLKSLCSSDANEAPVWSRSGYLPLISVILMSVPFLPASNLFFRVGFVVAERILYIPSMGFCLLVTHAALTLASKLPRVKGHLLTLFLLLLLVWSARTWERNKVWKSREALFWSGVRSLPHNAKVHYNLANLLKDEGDIRGAEYHYRTAVRLYPDVASYHLNLGTVLSNKSESQLCYQEALRLRPDHPSALVNLGSLLLDQGDLSGLSYVQQALTVDPDHIEGLLTISYAMVSAGNFTLANQYIRRALQLRPNSASTHLCYAVYLHNIGDTDAALKEYNRTLNFNPRESQALLHSAKLLMSEGKNQEAKQRLIWAVDVDQDCSDCHTQLGIVYSRLGLTKDAVVTLEHAATLAPNNTYIKLKYVQVLKESGRREDAWHALESFLDKSSQDLEVLKFAFRLAMEENNFARATVFAQTAVDVAERVRDASVGDLYQDLAEVYRLSQDYKHALEYYERAVAAKPRLLDAILNAGSIYFMQKNYQQAEKYYLQVLEMDQTNQLAKENLAKLRKVYPQNLSMTKR